MKDGVVSAVNAQINAELDSAYLYLAMSAKMHEQRLPGLAQWLRIQWEEELLHAMKLYDFLVQRDAEIVLDAITQQDVTFDTPLEAFEAVLEHEKFITERIDSLYELATREQDYSLQSLLQWFIDEQVEEEDNARAAIDALRLLGDSGPGLFLFDREMASRQAAPEASGAA
jgi:ferritin